MTPEEVLANTDHTEFTYGKLISLYGISVFTDQEKGVVYYIGPYDKERIVTLEKMSGYTYIEMTKEEFSQKYPEYVR